MSILIKGVEMPPVGTGKVIMIDSEGDVWAAGRDEYTIIDGAKAVSIPPHGRLVILPCKVGDKVFRVVPKCSASYIQCPFNGGYGIDRCNNCDAFIKEELFCLFMFEEIGKTVFLTREEAEAALKRGAE